MSIQFDPAKDEINRRKHGISLARAVDMEMRAVVKDDRTDYGERRFRAFGFIDGIAHSLAFTLRGESLRAISLRRAHAKEMKRYGL